MSATVSGHDLSSELYASVYDSGPKGALPQAVPRISAGGQGTVPRGTVAEW